MIAERASGDALSSDTNSALAFQNVYILNVHQLKEAAAALTIATWYRCLSYRPKLFRLISCVTADEKYHQESHHFSSYYFSQSGNPFHRLRQIVLVSFTLFQSLATGWLFSDGECHQILHFTFENPSGETDSNVPYLYLTTSNTSLKKFSRFLYVNIDAKTPCFLVTDKNAEFR